METHCGVCSRSHHTKFRIKGYLQMNELKIFENEQFGAIRAITQNDEPWFVAADVCRALELGNSRQALARLDDDEKGVISTDTPGGEQKMNIVNEPGLYTLVLGSRKPEAKAFKRWVTHEVIPSIRRHGVYATAETAERLMNDPDFMIRTFTALKEEREMRKALENQIELDRPKVEFANAVHETKSNITVEKFAKLVYDETGLKVGRNKMFKLLRSNGYLNESNIPYQRYIDSGYFSTCEVMKYGKPYIVTLITGKGQLKLFKEISGVKSRCGNDNH